MWTFLSFFTFFRKKVKKPRFLKPISTALLAQYVPHPENSKQLPT